MKELVPGEIRKACDEALAAMFLTQKDGCDLQGAMRYALLGTGKRLRPSFLVQSAALFGVPPEQSLRAALAVEIIHVYSLVHDDLPAMDDALIRHHRAALHRLYGEDTAILAGDALQAAAFEILSDKKTHPEGEVRCLLCATLARAAGWAGMAGGQMRDMQSERLCADIDSVCEMERMKTGALFGAACAMGGALGGADAADIRFLEHFGQDFGLAYQVVDDLHDFYNLSSGKPNGQDAALGKMTLLAFLSPPEVIDFACSLLDKARTRLVERFNGGALSGLLAPLAMLRSMALACAQTRSSVASTQGISTNPG